MIDKTKVKLNIHSGNITKWWFFTEESQEVIQSVSIMYLLFVLIAVFQSWIMMTHRKNLVQCLSSIYLEKEPLIRTSEMKLKAD